MTAQNNVYLTKSPYCDHILDPATAVDGWVTCPCGHRSAVNWVNELGWLQARTAWVTDRIKASEPWFDSQRFSSAQVSTTEGHEAAPRLNAGQQVLYILGGLSLIVAVVVFAAVAWERIGALGQAASLVVVTIIASLIAIKTKKSLVGLSNTAAIVATGVAATGLISAPLLGLFPEWWSDASSFYPLTITILVGGISFAAGLRTAIVGWQLMAAPTVFISSLLLTQSIVRENIGDSWVTGIAVVTITLAVLLLDRVAVLLIKVNPENSAPTTLTVVASIALSSIGVLTSLEVFGYFDNRSMNAAFFVGAAILWMAVARYWVTDVSEMNRHGLTTRYAHSYSAILGALAIAQLMSPDSNATSISQMWLTLVGGAVVGAAILLAPYVFPKVLSSWSTQGTIAASTIWFITFGSGNSVMIYQDSDRLPILMVFFALVSAALLARWIYENQVIYFVGGLIAGVGAVVSFSNAYVLPEFDVPEAVTFPLAVWLFIAFRVLQSRTAERIPSLLSWGLALAVAIIPSAAVAVALVDTNEESTTTAWVRFWIVLMVSIALVVAGTKWHKAGLLIPGAVSFALVAFPQIWVQLSLIIPRWVFFALLGSLLITIAARFEYIQKISRASGSWFTKLE
ncbi:MAG: hypothetical protein RIS75_800 [Actinomycetota bacterium]